MIMVPSIHVLLPPQTVPNSPAPSASSCRSQLIDHLARAFHPPDLVAAELLLLFLISSPTFRPHALPPLGTLSLNFITIPEKSLESTLEALVPALVSICLNLDWLHNASVFPSSDSSSLDAGLLQLAQGTLLLIDETGMGEGGKLEEKAVRNLQALTECIRDQKLRYDYPYMDGLKMNCAIRSLAISEGKSLLPVSAAYRARSHKVRRSSPGLISTYPVGHPL